MVVCAQLRGVLAAFLMFQTSIVTTVVALLPAALLLLVPSRCTRYFFRRYAQFWQEAWFPFAVALLQYLVGTRLFIHVPSEFQGLQGVRLKCSGHNVVIVKNHRTRIDWMFTWGLCLALNRLGSLKIVLKDSLKSAPGVGWAMQFFGFIFLSRRNRETDLATLQTAVSYQCREPGAGMTLLIFPEGTDLSSSNLEKSQKFAREKGLEVYAEVLHPKTAGLVAVAESAIPSTLLLDATIAYVEHRPGERPDEKGLFYGRPPREIHLRIESVEALPSKDKMDGVCRSIFAAKEKRLAKFYGPLRDVSSLRPDVAAFAEGCQLFPLAAAPGACCRMCGGAAIFVALEAAVFWVCWVYPLKTLLWAASGVCVFVAVTRSGGVDGLERWHARCAPAV